MTNQEQKIEEITLAEEVTEQDNFLGVKGITTKLFPLSLIKTFLENFFVKISDLTDKVKTDIVICTFYAGGEEEDDDEDFVTTSMKLGKSRVGNPVDIEFTSPNGDIKFNGDNLITESEFTELENTVEEKADKTNTVNNVSLNSGALYQTINGSEEKIGDVAIPSDIVQSDWNETNENAKSFIKNKPAGLIVDDELSLTSEHSVQNKVITANMFVVFASKTYEDNTDFILPDEIPMVKGVRIKFVQDHFDMLKNDFDNNFTINSKYVYVNKNGTPILMPDHTVNGVTFCVMQKYAAVEMVYMPELNGNNGGWLVLGNPEVITGGVSTENYKIFSNGYCEQEAIFTGPYSQNGFQDWIFPVPFIELPKIAGTWEGGYTRFYIPANYWKVNSVRVQGTDNSGKPRVCITAKGYC